MTNTATETHMNTQTFKQFYNNMQQIDESYSECKKRAKQLPSPQRDAVLALISKHEWLHNNGKLKADDKNIDVITKNNAWNNLAQVLSKYSEDDFKTRDNIRVDTKVWSNQTYTVYKPRNAFDCDKLAHGQTRWCVASGDLNECKLNWKKYVTFANATFYIAIANENTKLPDEDQRLLAIIKHADGEIEILDRENTEVFPDESLLTEEELQEIVNS